jgi:hypothetical protein
MEPGLEEIGIAQRSELAPGGDQRGLNGILGQICVAQDPYRDRHHRSPTERARASNAPVSPFFARSTSAACTHPSKV